MKGEKMEKPLLSSSTGTQREDRELLWSRHAQIMARRLKRFFPELDTSHVVEIAAGYCVETKQECNVHNLLLVPKIRRIRTRKTTSLRPHASKYAHACERVLLLMRKMRLLQPEKEEEVFSYIVRMLPEYLSSATEKAYMLLDQEQPGDVLVLTKGWAWFENNDDLLLAEREWVYPKFFLDTFTALISTLLCPWRRKGGWGKHHDAVREMYDGVSNYIGSETKTFLCLGGLGRPGWHVSCGGSIEARTSGGPWSGTITNSFVIGRFPTT